jgi:hypothetical protein
MSLNCKVLDRNLFSPMQANPFQPCPAYRLLVLNSAPSSRAGSIPSHSWYGLIRSIRTVPAPFMPQRGNVPCTCDTASVPRAVSTLSLTNGASAGCRGRAETMCRTEAAGLRPPDLGGRVRLWRYTLFFNRGDAFLCR